eukprot:CAMPEP_0184492202 /NCGR_PEP_ID=MMETSP0113_2-20130426/22592_1 /TAXON_ID=91329 /ORGANISM="Norrisiella sphaerica, Strain BC52" /LENGTH=314 /DNA_ID=CAMNT_0026876881 /DNA_START=27 /DNA_END=968 /DNA_ORIENTATION=+
MKATSPMRQSKSFKRKTAFPWKPSSSMKSTGRTIVSDSSKDSIGHGRRHVQLTRRSLDGLIDFKRNSLGRAERAQHRNYPCRSPGASVNSPYVVHRARKRRPVGANSQKLASGRHIVDLAPLDLGLTFPGLRVNSKRGNGKSSKSGGGRSVFEGSKSTEFSDMKSMNLVRRSSSNSSAGQLPAPTHSGVHGSASRPVQGFSSREAKIPFVNPIEDIRNSLAEIAVMHKDTRHGGRKGDTGLLHISRYGAGKRLSKREIKIVQGLVKKLDDYTNMLLSKAKSGNSMHRAMKVIEKLAQIKEKFMVGRPFGGGTVW